MGMIEDTHGEPTPASLGFRMPAEWEPHSATWLSWPHREGISFPDAYDKVMPAFARMVDALADSEAVHINVLDAAQEKDVLRILSGVRHDHVKFFHVPTNEPWCRDHGPVFLVRDEDPKLACIDWGYNAWGFKYPPFDLDDSVPTAIGEKLGLRVFHNDMIFEGGSVDVNGAGTLLTTKSCLLNPNRNPDLTRAEIEKNLKDYLGVQNILWLGDGIDGDDTDGHIDDLTRFVGPNSVVTALEEDEDDPNYDVLQTNLKTLEGMTGDGSETLDIITLPMPSPIRRQGIRLPASYANFYIANKVVLLPSFGDVKDKWAVTILQKIFTDREVIPIDCRELIWGLGAFHCLTQQQPLV